MDQLRGGATRIAFFGGSFDPPHLGHLAIARAARAALSLNEVLFAPVGAQPLKPKGSSADFDDRVAMTRLAIAGEPAFSVSLVDAPAKSGKPNYTLNTLRRLRAEQPRSTELFFLMGADSFLTLRSWHRAAEIPFAAQLIVASRPGQSLEDLAAALPAGLTMEPAPELTPDTGDSPVEVRSFQVRNSAGASAPLFFLPAILVEVSATEIRERIQKGQENDLLPPKIASYIRMHQLYR